MVESLCNRRGPVRLKRLATWFHGAHAAVVAYYLVARTWYPASSAFMPTDYLTEIGLTREIELWLMGVLWLWRKWNSSGTLEEFADSALLTAKVVAGSVLYISGGATELLRFGLLWGLVLAVIQRPDYRSLGCVESLSPTSLAMRAAPCDKRLDDLRPDEDTRVARSGKAAAESARRRGLGCQVVPAEDADVEGSDAPPETGARWVGEGEAGDGKLEGLVPWLVMVEASWSDRCWQLAPMVAELSEQFRGCVRFGRVDVARWPDAARVLNVDASTSSSPQVPTFILFRGGREARRVPAVDPATGKARDDAGVVSYNGPALAAAMGLLELKTKAAGRSAAVDGTQREVFRRTDAPRTAGAERAGADGREAAGVGDGPKRRR